MKAYVGNTILIEDATDEIMQRYTKLLTFENPQYYKAQNMGKSVWKIPREIVLYQMRGKDLIIPFGMLHTVFGDRDCFAKIENRAKTATPERISYGSSITPYDYQERAIQAAIRAKNGIVVAPCGAGKTQIALEIVARLGLRTLWLTHTTDLMQQSMERAKKNFGLDVKKYGTISAGKVRVGEAITFATVQTMSRIDLDEFRDYWDVVIVDECHKCVGTPTNIMMFYKCVNSLCARYKIGVTATPERSDGLIGCMYALLGNKIYEVSREDVKDTTCPVSVFKVPTSYKPDYESVLAADGTINYPKLITNLVEDTERNKEITDNIIDCVNHWDSYEKPVRILVLSERVEHLNILRGLCVERGISVERIRILSDAGNTRTVRGLRKTALADLESGKVSIVFATYQLAKEGLDVPSLQYLVFASPQKNKTTVIQSVGRVSRKAPGKRCGVVTDYVDDFGMLLGYSKQRDKYYRQIGCEIIE